MGIPAYALVAGVHPESLKDLTGHVDRTMVCRTYGKRGGRGLVADRPHILACLGEDFVERFQAG